MKHKNITRYTYEKTAFQGWRLNICRNCRQFTKYFSDRQYGNEDSALEAALRLRDTILAELKAQPCESGLIFDRYR